MATPHGAQGAAQARADCRREGSTRQAGIHTLTVGFIYNKGNKYKLKNRNILLLSNNIYLAQKLLGMYQKSNNTL